MSIKESQIQRAYGLAEYYAERAMVTGDACDIKKLEFWEAEWLRRLSKQEPKEAGL